MHEAQAAQLWRLLEQAHAGQEIILTQASMPCARLMPATPQAPARRPGRLRGRLSDAFFEPLPADETDGGNRGR